MYFECLFFYLFWVKSHLLVIDNKIIDVACMRAALSIIIAGVIMCVFVFEVEVEVGCGTH